MSYFKYFPQLLYSTSLNAQNFVQVPNILSKVNFIKNTLNNSALYFEYTVRDGEKPEDIASKLYDDPFKHWIILLANDITDPQFDWVLSYNSFQEYINKKYSSVNIQLDTSDTYSGDYIASETLYQGSSIDKSIAYGHVISYDNINKILHVNFLTDSLDASQPVTGSSSGVTHNVASITINNDGFNWASNTHIYYETTERKYNTHDKTVTNSSYKVTNKTYNFATKSIVDNDVEYVSSTSSTPISDGSELIIEKTTAPISYYQYEDALNEEKRKIKIPKKEHVSVIESQFKSLLGG